MWAPLTALMGGEGMGGADARTGYTRFISLAGEAAEGQRGDGRRSTGYTLHFTCEGDAAVIPPCLRTAH